MISINPSKDNTLYQYNPNEGDLSNALGFHFFTGTILMGESRRGVLAFDIAGNVPPGSTITGVSLSMNIAKTIDGTARTTELHKLFADWGEGTSRAPGEEGSGAPATPNDATWRHRFYDTIFWTTQGGDFSATVSASQSVGGLGQYIWSSTQMIGDVQSWLDNPVSNFGWLVLGVESTTPKRVIIRAIGPELGQFGVPDPLQDPTLELHDGTGALIGTNDNWQTTIIGGIITHDQVQEIQDSGYAPGDGRESAIIADLPAGNYTAIVRGVNNTTGVALVEVYDLGP